MGDYLWQLIGEQVVAKQFRLEAKGPFSLCHDRVALPDLVVEGSWRTAGVCIRQDSVGVAGEVDNYGLACHPSASHREAGRLDDPFESLQILVFDLRPLLPYGLVQKGAIARRGELAVAARRAELDTLRERVAGPTQPHRRLRRPPAGLQNALSQAENRTGGFQSKMESVRNKLAGVGAAATALVTVPLVGTAPDRS